MQYEEFEDFVKRRCFYETIYVDSEGRTILVLDMLSAFAMANKFEEVGRWPSAAIGKETLQDALARENGTPPQRKPLTDEEIQYAFRTNSVMVDNGNAYMVAGKRAINIARAIEAAHGIGGEA